MGQFKKYGGPKPKDFSFGGGKSGGPKKYGGRDRDRGDRGPKQMHSATCSDCGKRCEIPFRPTGKHPVFCSDCFRNKDDAGSRYTPKQFVKNNRDSYERNSGRTTSAPVAQSAPASSGVSQKQFDSLERKLDDILSLLHTQRRDAEFAKEKKAPKTAVKKTVAKKVAVKKTVKKVAKKAAKKTPVKKSATKKSVAKKIKATKKKK